MADKKNWKQPYLGDESLAAYRDKIDTVTRRARTMWEPRDRQIREDRALRILTKPEIKPGFEKVVLNKPKVLFDTCVALLSSAPVRYRLPRQMEQTAEQKQAGNKTERFLVGAKREIEERQIRRGLNGWRRDLSFWICSGWYAVFPLVTRKDKGVEFWGDIYDPLTVYPEWGHDRLLHLTREYATTADTVGNMCRANDWKVPDWLEQEENVTMTSFWEDTGEEVVNSIVVSCQTSKSDFLKLPRIEPFPHIPIIIGPAGGSPERADVTDEKKDWASRVGENVIAANRDEYAYYNKLVSLMMQIVSDVAYPPMAEYTETGKGRLTRQDMGSGTIIPRRFGEKLEAIKIASAPVEVNNLLGMFSKDLQQGGLPDVTFGGLQFELSGFALSQLLASIRYKLAPYEQAMRYVDSKVCVELLRQYREGDEDGKFPPIQLVTEQKYGINRGEFFMEEFAPNDIPDVYFVDVELTIQTPMDKSQQIALAKEAVNPPALLSKETLLEEYLGIQDIELELDRQTDDQLDMLPFVKAMKLRERLWERAEQAETAGDTEQAQTLRFYIQKLEEQMGLPPQTTAPGKAGIKIPPEIMPPEMGGLGADQMRAAQGIPPPAAPESPRQGLTSEF